MGLRNSVQRGFARWSEFTSSQPNLRAPLSPRTQANFIYDHVLAVAKNEFNGVDGFYFREECGLEFLDVRGRILLRFKKLDQDGLPVNYPTDQQVRINKQEDLPGIPPGATWVYVGYKLNQAGTDLQSIQLLCMVGKRRLWQIPTSDEPGSTQEIFPVTDPEQPAQPAPKVRPKGAPKREANE